jgi:hypothetical protein
MWHHDPATCLSMTDVTNIWQLGQCGSSPSCTMMMVSSWCMEQKCHHSSAWVLGCARQLSTGHIVWTFWTGKSTIDCHSESELCISGICKEGSLWISCKWSVREWRFIDLLHLEHVFFCSIWSCQVERDLSYWRAYPQGDILLDAAWPKCIIALVFAGFTCRPIHRKSLVIMLRASCTLSQLSPSICPSSA